MSQNVGEVDIKVQLDKASLSSSLRSAKGDVDSWASDVESRTSKLGSSLAGVAKTGLLAAGAATVSIATAGLSSYRDLEEASSHAASKAVDVYGKSAEEIGAEYDKLLKHVQDVSADVGASTVFSDIEVAKTFDALAAGGVNIADVGRNELLPFMNLASSTGEDLTRVTDLLTGSMASFGYGMEDSEVIADQLAMAMNGSKASMETLNYALRQGGSTAAATGMELSEFSAIVGVLADRNYTGEQSGAALKTSMLALYNPTKTQSEALAKLGITYDQIDPRVHGFRETLELLLDKGADIGDFGQIFTDSSGAVMYALAEEGDAVDALKTKIVGSQGLSQTMSDLMMDTDRLVGAWEEAKGATMGMVTAIGGYLEPAAVKLLNAWKTLVPALREFGSAIASGDWSKVGELLGNAWTVAKEKGMEFLSWASTALQSVDWGSIASQTGELIASGIKTGISILSSIGSWIYDYIINFDYTAAGTTIAGWIKQGITVLQGIGATIGGWIENHGGWQGVGRAVGEKIASGIRALTTYAQGIADRLKEWYNSSGQGVGQDIGNKIAAGIKAVQTYADGIKTRLQDWINSGGAKNIGEDMGNAVANGIKAVADLGKWIADSFAEKGGGNAVIGAIKTGVEWYNLGKDAVSDFVSGFIAGLAPIGNEIRNAVLDGLASAFDMDVDFGDSVLGKGLNYIFRSTDTDKSIGDYIRSQKIETDWNSRTYDSKTGTWVASSSGGDGSSYDTSRYNIGRSGDVYYLYDKKARNSTGRYTETMGAYSSKKDAEEAARALTEGAEEAARVDTAAAQTNANTIGTAVKKSTADINSATEYYKSASTVANANNLSTYSWINNNLRSTSSSMSSDLKIGSSAILEAGRVTKTNFELGGYNWLNNVNQSKNIQTSAANQSAAIALSSTNERTAIEISSANAASLYTTAAGLGLKSNVDTSGSDFVSKVGTAADSAASAINRITSLFGGGIMGGGASGGGSWSSGTTNFTDCLFEGGFVDGCTGVSIPGLKYTNPQGVTSIINPMDYISGNGITNYIGLTGGSYGGSSSGSYTLPPVLRARGGLIEKPEVALIGEAGSEMVLPHDITQELVDLTNMGRTAKGMGPAGDIVVKLYLDGRELTNAVMSRSTSMMRQKGLTIRG